LGKTVSLIPYLPIQPPSASVVGEYPKAYLEAHLRLSAHDEVIADPEQEAVLTMIWYDLLEEKKIPKEELTPAGRWGFLISPLLLNLVSWKLSSGIHASSLGPSWAKRAYPHTALCLIQADQRFRSSR
jgi:hypothetical protein